MSTRRTLGGFLRMARDGKSLSLRAVEAETGISNAYLSQLEGGKIQNPSPRTLYVLAQQYDISYTELLRLAEYPVPDDDARESVTSGIAARIGPVSEDEEDALVEYLAFLRARRKPRTR